MLTVELKSRYDVPCRWSELSRKQFTAAASAMLSFENGEIDYDGLRLKIVGTAMGLNLNRLKVTNELCENLFRISENLDYYRIVESDGRRTLEADIILHENKIPKVGRWRGYIFSLNGGVVDTDLTAERYVDTISLLTHYSRTKSAEALDRLVATLYCPAPYSAENARKVNVKSFSKEVKAAVILNFRGVLEWIQRLPKYDIIFHTVQSAGKAAPIVGPEGTIYRLSKSGFGSVEEIGRLPLFSYLDIQLTLTCNSIREMHGMKMSITEICDRTHLTPAQVATVLQL